MMTDWLKLLRSELWIDIIHPSQWHVLKAEDFFAQTSETMNNISFFLGTINFQPRLLNDWLELCAIHVLKIIFLQFLYAVGLETYHENVQVVGFYRCRFLILAWLHLNGKQFLNVACIKQKQFVRLGSRNLYEEDETLADKNNMQEGKYRILWVIAFDALR